MFCSAQFIVINSISHLSAINSSREFVLSVIAEWWIFAEMEQIAATQILGDSMQFTRLEAQVT